MVHQKEDNIDFNFYTSDCNTFIDLIGKIRDTYDTDFRDLENIFPNPAEVYKIAHKKVYDDVLYTALREYLKGTCPCVFLLNLESCHKNIKILGSLIDTIDPGFNCSSLQMILFHNTLG